MHVIETNHTVIHCESHRKWLNQYEIIKEIGRGEFGHVKLALDQTSGRYYAIKLLDRKDKPRLGRPPTDTAQSKIRREIAILKRCCHPNLVRLHEFLDDPNNRKIYLVLEFCAKGEIRWQDSKGQPVLSRERARVVARECCLGLEFLHANMIIHRDIKPANLLLDAENKVKISDFGVSIDLGAVESLNSGERKCALELSKTVGTPAFFAPELCVPTEFDVKGLEKLQQVSSKVDVWAFGVTLYCLVYGQLPFQAENEYELFHVIYNAMVNFPEPRCKDDEHLEDLLRRLLTRDPNLRPSIQEIKSHPWLVNGLSSTDRERFVNDKPYIVPRIPLNSDPRRVQSTTQFPVKRPAPVRKLSKSSTNIAQHTASSATSATTSSSAASGSEIEGFRSKLKSSLTRLAEHMRPRALSRSKSLHTNQIASSRSSTSSWRTNTVRSEQSERSERQPIGRQQRTSNVPSIVATTSSSSNVNLYGMHQHLQSTSPVPVPFGMGISMPFATRTHSRPKQIHSDKASLNSDSVSYRSLKFTDSQDSLKMSEDSLVPSRSQQSNDSRLRRSPRHSSNLSSTSSSSSDGELMIVVGRNRSRSVGHD